MDNLRENQKKAINTSYENDFESGVHFHATGTGKSLIAMNIVNQYNQIHPTHNIFWICESKSILIDQFSPISQKERNISDIMRRFNVLNFSNYKTSDWVDSVNAAKFWNKPCFIIINRAFLVSDVKYRKIMANIHLIIHDECHSIRNKTTQEFYEYFLKEAPVVPKCIGFSATPHLEIAPFTKIISSYSIYDSFMDGIIVPPKIKWFSCEEMISQLEIIQLAKQLIENPGIIYKKIIIWCGMISSCEEYSKLWGKYFADYLICVDTSVHSTYDQFKEAESKAILFCACKHREGSDIWNLDCCIFLDKVENRSPKVFIQCIGRVLRLDTQGRKKFGLILDVKAKNSYAICSMMNEYLNLPAGVFPWKYKFQPIEINGKLIKINTLIMCRDNQNTGKKNLVGGNLPDIRSLFIREVPNDPKYIERLEYELALIQEKNLASYLIQAIQILNITKNMPHITRGSCGSSLVCYLLGISHVDPVHYNIKFARFLNEYRNNLPDIDLDFPHNLRNEVFLKIELEWSNQVARISNHVYYHEKSAVRQAIRNAGIHKFISKYDIDREIRSFPRDIQEKIADETKRLENKFKCYSLHCGGIVYYADGVPEELIINKSSSLQQIRCNKEEIAKDKNFKIDILSSRALSQLYEIIGYKNNLCFESFEYDAKTFKMLQRGDNIGITFAESPLMRLAFLRYKPNSLYDLAVCLSIIRPAAKDAKNVCEKNFEDFIIFDDDAIDFIAKECGISEAEGDRLRRGFAKGDKKSIEEFRGIIAHFPVEKQKEMVRKLSNLSRYSFCKAHAFSYAQLIWKLAYMKCHRPYDFWKATLNNCHSSYKKWVHMYEARIAGVNKNNLKKDDVSVYARNRRNKLETIVANQWWSMKSEEFYPGCFLLKEEDTGVYYFNGIIASSQYRKFGKERVLKLFIGVERKKYIHIHIHNLKYYNQSRIGIKGHGKSTSELDIIILPDVYEFF